MRDLKQALALVAACGLSAGCAVATSELDGEEAKLGSVQQALIEAKIVRRSVEGGLGEADLLCPAATPFALSVGGGLHNSLGINQQTFDMNDGEPVGAHLRMTNTSVNNSPWVHAVCSDYNVPTTIPSYDSDGDKTASCPANYVAVGGGGHCESSSARLTRSRPNPDTAGSEPTGWRATCSSGGVWAFANCAYKGGSTWDWNGCKVRKSTTTTSEVAYGDCNSGELVVAAGAYCGEGGFIEQMAVFSNLTLTDAWCSTNTTHAYAVCCPGVYKD